MKLKIVNSDNKILKVIKNDNYKNLFINYSADKKVLNIYNRAKEYTSSNFDHDNLQNTHNLTTDIDHNALTNYDEDEHIDWTSSQSEDIHPDNYTDTTYSAGIGLSLDGTEFNVDDVFLRNDGDTATGDYTFDTDTLHIDSTAGRVGIGTTDSHEKLHVDGNIQLGDGGSADNEINFGGNNYIRRYRWQNTRRYTEFDTSYNSDDAGVRFSANDDIMMALRKDGNNRIPGKLGIGVDSIPTTTLEVNGEAKLSSTEDMGSDDESLATKKYVDDNDSDTTYTAGTGLELDGTEFNNIDTGSDAVSTHESDYNHNNFLTNIESESIGDLNDVDLTDNDDNKILKYNSSSGNFEIADDENTTYESSDFDHDNLQNTHNLTTDIDHNSLTNYEENEHIDWTINSGEKIHEDNLPALALTEVFTVADDTERDNLDIQEGDVAIVDNSAEAGDEPASYIYNGTEWKKLKTPTDKVSSVFGRTGDIVAETNDYTWAQIDKTTSDIADINNRSHTDLTDIGTNSHSDIDTHIDDNSIHFSDLSDFDTDDLSEGTDNKYFTDARAISAIESADDYLKNDGDTASGDYTFNTDTLHIDSTDERVGIGTTSPDNKLTVNGDTNFIGNVGFEVSSPDGRIHLASEGYNDIFILERTNSSYAAKWEVSLANGRWNIGPYSHSTISNRKFMLDTDGKVSLGVEQSASSWGGIDHSLFVGGRITIGDGTLTYDNPSKALEVYGDSYISGNVGIGTTEPNAPLEVDGEARLTDSADMGSNDASLTTKKYVDDGLNTSMGTVVHGSTTTTSRPSGYNVVTWIGSVEPDNATNDDIWIDTS